MLVFSLPTLPCVQCSLLSWYHVTASSIHSTACWSNSAISLTMNHTCHWTQPFQSPFNSRTVGVAVVTPGEAALSPSLPILHIHHLQPAVVLIPILLPAQGHPVHSNFQVFSFIFPALSQLLMLTSSLTWLTQHWCNCVHYQSRAHTLT